MAKAGHDYMARKYNDVDYYFSGDLFISCPMELVRKAISMGEKTVTLA